jgi:8-oxo-dGTP pyrophosphatase MutT (NUDIX family)
MSRIRDAATLILIRDGREVLLGRRSAKHVFMPDRFVFPGGRVDPGDGRVAQPVRLRAAVERKLTRGCTPHRAGALAMAAVRETFEETGLLLGHPSDQPPRTRSPHWRDFFGRGFVPALDCMDYVARAITPPGRVRRFDARFFLADASRAHGSLQGNGELEELAFVPLEQVQELPLAIVTSMLFELLQEELRQDPEATTTREVPFLREQRGKRNLQQH